MQEAEAELTNSEERTRCIGRAEATFNRALEACTAKKDLEALMGRARLHQVKEQFKEALDQLNQVRARTPNLEARI